MPDIQKYVIRRAFVFPLGLLVLLVLTLLATCLIQGQEIAKILILVFLSLPLIILFFESALRRIEIDSKGVTAQRPLRSTRIEFEQVTGLETVQVRNRAFVTLTAGEDDFLIISNSYGHFPVLLNQLIAAVPETSVTEDAIQLAANPKKRHADIFTAWFAVVAMVYILVAQFLR